MTPETALLALAAITTSFFAVGAWIIRRVVRLLMAEGRTYEDIMAEQPNEWGGYRPKDEDD